MDRQLIYTTDKIIHILSYIPLIGRRCIMNKKIINVPYAKPVKKNSQNKLKKGCGCNQKKN